MFRTAVNIQNLLEWVEKAKRPFPNDSDTAFLSRLINTHYPVKQSIDSIYKAFDNITRPEKEVLNTVAQLKLSNITSFCPYFLHFSWGLFSQTKREADSDENTAAFQESNAQSRTATLVLMLTKLGTLQLLDKKFKKPEMHANYFSTINTLINEGHLNIRKCAEMKSSDFSTISK